MQMQAAAANSATAGMEAATARKMMADFRAAMTAQVTSLEHRSGVDAAHLTQVTVFFFTIFSMYMLAIHDQHDHHIRNHL